MDRIVNYDYSEIVKLRKKLRDWDKEGASKIFDYMEGVMSECFDFPLIFRRHFSYYSGGISSCIMHLDDKSMTDHPWAEVLTPEIGGIYNRIEHEGLACTVDINWKLSQEEIDTLYDIGKIGLSEREAPRRVLLCGV